jgi:hypothetical protein
MKEEEKRAALDKLDLDINVRIRDLLTELFPIDAFVDPALERFEDMELNAILSAMPYGHQVISV